MKFDGKKHIKIISLNMILTSSMCLYISPAIAETADLDYVYLDCNLYRSTDGDKEKSYNFEIHYAFNQSLNDIQVYQTHGNSYSTQCDISTCIISDNELIIKYASEKFSMNRSINRDTGSYSEFITEQKTNGQRSITYTTGNCKKGTSKIVKVRKF